jgi:glycosyltransferase involved in cell wall biosynthesis
MKTVRFKKNISVLVIEPYYGGSHESFLRNIRQLPFDFEFMTLPPRNWKWRMRLAAPYFAEKLWKSGSQFDRILCSSYLDVAAFRGIAPSWVREVPLLTYYHENQFAYPSQVEDERDAHFALTNITTAIASDSLAYNSEYNLSTFLKGTEGLLKHSPDLMLDDICSFILPKSRVLPPGIDFSAIDAQKHVPRNDAPVILWNHRWEHDKNPEMFFKALFKLYSEGIDFKLAVLGESFDTYPLIFDEARDRLSERIVHYGYIENGVEYARMLKSSDIVVSTSNHEFFGISVIEAVRAGCRPVLPKGLSYTQLFPENFLYHDKDFFKCLKAVVLRNSSLSPQEAAQLTEPFSWNTVAPLYEQWIVRPVSGE